MIPRAKVELATAIPAAATFWTPQPEDIGDEGFGFFQNVWPIVDVDRDEAVSLIEAERIAVAFVDSTATTAREFEKLANAIEDEYPEALSDEAPEFMHESSWSGLEGLELGVAGLVYAMAACGFFPAASCRSHHNGMQSWSDYPVVMFAADEAHARRLQPLLAASGCGLEGDSARSELLCVYAPSIVEIMNLAETMIVAPDEFL